MKQAPDAPRKLTAAEERRKAVFDRTAAALAAAGYRQADLTIGIVRANVLAVVLCLPIVAVLLMAFFALHPEGGGGGLTLGGILGFFAVILLLIFVHEGIHGLTWAVFAPNRLRAVSFGVIWQYLTPYCTCSQPLSRQAYALGGMMPTVLLGILPAAAGIFTGSMVLWGIGAVMIFAGGGDLAIFLKLLSFRPGTGDVVYLDHPYECGLVAFLRAEEARDA